MSATVLALAASAAGLAVANSLHCAGMCGAFALTARARPEWHLGRLTTYAALGALAGGLGGAAAAGSAAPALRLGAAVIASVVLVFFSLQIAGWVPRSGGGAARLVAPLSRLLRDLAQPGAGGMSAGGSRFLLGIAGSLVPCGVVYGGLALAAIAGSAPLGALVMLGFGLGTVPSMVLVGAGGTALARLGKRASLRRVAALVALLIGLASIWWRAPLPSEFDESGPPACHIE